MDLIYTNAKRVDQGVLSAYALDLSFGSDENDFELTLGSEPVLEFGAFIYIEGTEYGGIIDAKKTSTDGETVIYTGRTWQGLLNSKVIQPDDGADYFVVSGDLNEVLRTLVTRLGLDNLFSVSAEDSGITVSKYKFNRYCYGYDGISAMLSDVGGKLKLEWIGRKVQLSAQPVVNYADSPVDGDMASLTVEQYGNKVNHLICLGRGELAERQVVHLYVDQFGRIGTVQYYTGVDERSEVYDNSNVATVDELKSGGIKRLKELWSSDSAEMDVLEQDDLVYDIGDIIGATDVKSGITIVESVKQKIVRIDSGKISTEYKTSGIATSKSGSANSTGSGGGITEIPVASSTTLGAIKVGNNLEITGDGKLSVVTTNDAQKDNTKPITSAGVHTQIGNIEVLLAAL